MIMVRRFVTAALLSTVPVILSAQAPAAPDPMKGSLKLVVVGSKGGSDQPVKMGRDGKPEPQPLAGATVHLKDGAVIGTTSDSGTVTLGDLPDGRLELTFRAKGHNELRCRLRVRAGAQERIDVQMLPVRAVAVWNTYGCKARG